MKSVTVQGVDVPALGLGTYQLRGDTCRDVVETALELGYRHVDTATYYRNERAVGEGVAAAPVSREDVFITTKVWQTDLAYDDVIRSANESLARLGTDYVDLLLVHWPSQTVPVEETLAAMAELRDAGRVRHVGVSNFDVDGLAAAIEESDAPILTDQVRYHPLTDRQALLAFCIQADVLLTAYSPLAKGRAAKHDLLCEIGSRHGKTAAQVALRWLVQQDHVAAIPKASSEAHLRENLAVFDFELSAAEVASVFDLQGGLLTKLASKLGY